MSKFGLANDRIVSFVALLLLLNENLILKFGLNTQRLLKNFVRVVFLFYFYLQLIFKTKRKKKSKNAYLYEKKIPKQTQAIPDRPNNKPNIYKLVVLFVLLT